MLNTTNIFPYLFSATQTYSPLLVLVALKVRVLWLWESGQDEQLLGMDQLYTGSGDDDTEQFSITSSLTFTPIAWLGMDINAGGPVENYSKINVQ